jgi:VWFA-related protein
VHGLSAADFEITDNGVTQRVESVAAGEIPLDLSLIVDATWYSQGLAGADMGPAGTHILHGNARQIAGLLGAGDRFEVASYAAAVVQARAMSPPDPNSELSLGTVPTTYSLDRRYRITQALGMALMAPVASDRRHVVLLFATGRGEPELPSLEHIVRIATRADALLYAVLTPELQDARTHQPAPLFPSQAFIRDAVTRAAESTGGKAFLTGEIVGAFRDILKEFRQRYVLRYSLRDTPTEGWHDIVVTVPSCPGCTIHARRGYMGR